MKEIFPYQWKIALSWISGYFIFQLFNPVLFAAEGAVVAGQMGMTLQVLNAIQAFAMSWQNTKVPLYSGLIEMKQYVELDRVFNKTLRQMISVCSVLFSLFFIVIAILRISNLKIGGSVIGDRFLGFLPLILMTVSVFINLIDGSWATYLRCHKKEPYLAISVVMGALCCVSTVCLGNQYGVIGVACGYCFLKAFVGLPWAYTVFRTKRIAWHN